MALGRVLFYDWAGANTLLFAALNGGGSPLFNDFMMQVSRVSDYAHFPYYFLGLLCWALLDFSLRRIRKRGGAKHRLAAWAGVLLVAVLSSGVTAAAALYLKTHLAMPRPYVALGPENVTRLEYSAEPDNDYRSLPSGHVAFVTMLLTALWPVLSPARRMAGMLAVALVAWSRIAVGMHFPADVFYAALLALSITALIRWCLYRQLLRLRLRC